MRPVEKGTEEEERQQMSLAENGDGEREVRVPCSLKMKLISGARLGSSVLLQLHK